MKRLIGLLIVLVFCLPAASWAQQDEATPRVEITGVNANDLPTVTITANVFDAFNQPVRGLEASNFELTGPLAQNSRITSVQNLTDNNLPFGVVLAIDVSSSMTDKPITQAKQAAQTFVDAIGANNPIAIYTFASKFTLVQDFTSDKAALHSAIDSIQVGGQTGLYQAAYNAIDLAAGMDIPRRAVILLSDGAEYGGISEVTRAQTLDHAKARGVPVYTVGLGYGVDRSYLKTLAQGTNAQFFESPDPEQLSTIYNALATLLRSQYVVTVQADIPLDGTEYDVNLRVTTPDGSGSATSTLRAPIPVPIVTLPDLSAPITEKTKVEATVKADDEVQEVDLQIDGGDAQKQTGAPYTFNIEPFDLTPGQHQIDVKAVDAQGDTGTASATITVAALPPQVSITSNFDKGPIENTQSAFLNIQSQTPVVSVVYTIDGANPQTITDEPYKYDVQPLFYKPGDHQLSVTVTEQSGQSTTIGQAFTVATLPPYVVVTGLEEGQTVAETLYFEVDTVASQSPVTDVTIKVNGVRLDNRSIAQNDIVLSTAEIDPHAFPSGTNTLSVTATNADGKTGSTPDIHFEVPSLPPVVVFENLTEGQQLSADLDAAVSFISQTPITLATYFVDDTQVRRRTGAPWNLTLDVLALGPGPHSLRVVADAAGGQESTGVINFVVTSGPSLTATALVPTIDAPATATEVAVRITATAVYEATIAAATQGAQDATATQFAFAATGTAEFRATIVQQSRNIQSTATENANQFATATQSAVQQVTATQNAALTATRDARSTQDALAEQRAQGTANAQSTQAARATANAARTTATAQAQAAATQAATSTLAFRATVVQQSLDIRATATENANRLATATVEQATQDAQVTAVALAATATQTAQLAITNAASTATESAQATATQAALASVTLDAQATASEIAQVTATQVAFEQAVSTRNADATATRVIQVTMAAQAEINARGTVDAQATRDVVILTQNARSTATEIELRAEATETQTALIAGATMTQNAEATRAIQLAAIGALTVTPTPEPTSELTAVAQVASPEASITAPPTLTPMGTLVAVEVQSQAGTSANQLIPLVVIGAVLVILLLVIFLIVGRNRRR